MAKGLQEKNFDYYLTADFSEYKGEWVAIYNGKVKAHSKSFHKLLDVLDIPRHNALFTYIPKKKLFIIRKV